ARSRASFKRGTRHTGFRSSAPALLFTASLPRRAVPVLGTSRACAPKHSALRAMAPRLRTSVTWSMATIKGVSPRSKAMAITSSMSCSSTWLSRAITPWCSVRVRRSSFSTGTSCQGTCRSCASRRISRMPSPPASRRTSSFSTLRPAVRASITGRIPQMRSFLDMGGVRSAKVVLLEWGRSVARQMEVGPHNGRSVLVHPPVPPALHVAVPRPLEHGVALQGQIVVRVRCDLPLEVEGEVHEVVLLAIDPRLAALVAVDGVGRTEDDVHQTAVGTPAFHMRGEVAVGVLHAGVIDADGLAGPFAIAGRLQPELLDGPAHIG